MTDAGSTGRRAWFVLTAGTFAYLCAVTQRSTLGVAGIAAADRFHVSAAALSTLGVLQLVTYAALQIPVGIMVDRFGPKSVLAVGAALMAVGQVVVAISLGLPEAVLGRILVGAGDATTFVSVLRLVNAWFPGRRVPVISQWVGNVGGLGQVLSAIPFAAVLGELGWERGFLTASGLAVVGLIVIVVLIADGPAISGNAPSGREVVIAMRASMRRPGTQLGFWSHFVTQSSGTVFALFWGFPFLVSAIGLPATGAAALLTVQTASALVAGPALGVLTSRFPWRRSNLVIGIVSFIGIVWTAVLLWPGTPPLALLLLLVVAMGIGGPGSQIGFDFARTFNPMQSLGSANGVVNVGGFTASFTMMLLIGVLLDVQHGASIASGHPHALYSLGAFRIAFCVQYLVVGAGVVMLLRARRHTRQRMEDVDGVSITPLWSALNAARINALRRRRRERHPAD